MEANPPKNKKEFQRFLGQVNYLRRFISNLAGKTKEFSQLLKLKDSREFKWEESHQKAFDVIKRYLSNPPVIMPPRYGMALKLYISAAHESIGCLLVQNNHERNEQAIYYLSRFLTPVEVKYYVIEKLCLTLYYACTKLRHYLIQSRIFVVAKTDLIKYMLNRPILSGRIGKWSLTLVEFTLTYYPQKSVKGQVIAYFLADHASLDEFIGEQVGFPVCGVGVRPWELKFDGLSTETTARAGIVISSPRGVKTALSFNLGFQCTNNQAEYEALVIGLEILKDLGAKELLISGDSQLVLKQLSGEFKCTSLSLAPYYTASSQLLDDFEEVSLVHVPRQENWEADELAQQIGIQVDTLNLDINLAGDWRDDMKQSNGQAEASNKVLIKILQKMMEENPRDWPRLLSETLWAYRTSKRTATGVSHFFLTFGHDAVLPLEIMVQSMRVARQNKLPLEHYNEAMITELEELDELRIQAYNALLLQK
ncbi:uncharacterized protein [Primulina huaijiensis]|uniref:uncharacterized protein n=1 Tax=Primulina huaijiensis TaxID=1492673 RepID=UPI003CC71BD0